MHPQTETQKVEHSNGVTVVGAPEPNSPHLLGNITAYFTAVTAASTAPAATLKELGQRGVALRVTVIAEAERCRTLAADPSLEMALADGHLAARDGWLRAAERLLGVLANLRERHGAALASEEQERRAALRHKAEKAVKHCKLAEAEQAFLTAMRDAEKVRALIVRSNAQLPDGQPPLAVPPDIAEEVIISEHVVNRWVLAGRTYVDADIIPSSIHTKDGVRRGELRQARGHWPVEETVRHVAYRKRGSPVTEERIERVVSAAEQALAARRAAETAALVAGQSKMLAAFTEREQRLAGKVPNGQPSQDAAVALAAYFEGGSA